jgi:uncharacterized protein (DUF934 family)
MHKNKIIRNGKITEDDWQTIAKDVTDIPVQANLILPVAVWHKEREALGNRKDIGIWFDSEDLPANDWTSYLQALPLIAVNFPVFSDGRGFSIARLLRERYHYKGELRAIGYVLRDQLCFMKRCGFNSFQLPENTDLTAALESLDDFSEYYQTSVDQPLPLFRRN